MLFKQPLKKAAIAALAFWGGIAGLSAGELLVDRSSAVAAFSSSSSFLASDDQLVLFGDSLSDVGNVAGFGGPERYSNGPLFFEYFADHHSIPRTGPSDDGGLSFARRGNTTAQMVGRQLSDYLSVHGSGDLPANAVFVIWGGSNDYLEGVSSTNGVANIKTLMEELIARGGKRFLVLNQVYPRGAPLFSQPAYQPLESSARNFAVSFNEKLTVALDALELENADIELRRVDAFALYDEILDNAAAFGLNNLSNRGDQDPEGGDDFFYWDTVHPTTRAHRIVAERVERALGNWHFQPITTHHGSDALQSGAIDPNQSASVEIEVEGAGTLEFWWKVSSQENQDFLRLYVNEALHREASGEIDWRKETIELPVGKNRIRWTYAKGSGQPGGMDAAWLDAVSFAGSYEIVGFANVADWGSVAGGGIFDEGADAELTAVPNTGYEFLYWIGDAPEELVLTNPLPLPASENRSITAIFAKQQPVNEWLSVELSIQPSGGATLSLAGVRGYRGYVVEWSPDLKRWEELEHFQGLHDQPLVNILLADFEVGFIRVRVSE